MKICGTSDICIVSFQRKVTILGNCAVYKASILEPIEFNWATFYALMMIFSNASLHGEVFLLEHSLQDHFVFSLLIWFCFSADAQITLLRYLKLILSRKAILISASIKVNICVMTHVFCLISEISCDWVSLLLVCILLLLSEDRAVQCSSLHFVRHLLASFMCCEWINRRERRLAHFEEEDGDRGSGGRNFEKSACFCTFFRWLNRGSRSSGLACWDTLSTWTWTHSSLRRAEPTRPWSSPVRTECAVLT